MHNALLLLAAIGCEVGATTALNYTHQFTKLIPSVITVVGYVASFYLLSMALRTIPIGIAYAIWSGLGIVMITVIGVLAFKQTPDLPALIGIALIMAGVMVINLCSHMSVH
ncbi:MAG TPA: multidrug efflux SMR transporter [Candidatus Anaerobiospirillum stercoravium]|nr:multidrug efflux SMR transporter [Candidatus Anaerobiospirillum stercoravium]